MTRPAPSIRTLAALAAVTASTLAYQVIFTRLVSSVMAYHFTFLAISIALLGTGTGALLVYIRPDWFDRRPLSERLAGLSAVYGLLLVVTPLGLVRLDYSIDHGITRTFILNLALVCLLAALPALVAGAVVTLAIRGYPDHLGRVYAWDLVGAGLGALVVVPLLFLPAPQLLVGLGVLSGLAAVAFAWPHRPTARIGAAAAGLGAALLVVASFTSVLYLPTGYEGGESIKRADAWHPLSRVQAFELPDANVSLLFYDRVYAPVPLVRGDDLPTWEDMHLGPASIGYQITGPGRSLVIGAGGGRDIYNALTSDQEVDVIELNSGIVDAVDGDLGDLSGRPYSRPGVSTTIGDGRAILAQRDDTYDTIHIGFTDTLSANSAQGFALTENNLYTLEAFEEYLDHLAPGGVLNVSRLERLVGDEALRATVLVMAALERHGVEDPTRHILAVRGLDPVGTIAAPYVTVLARLEPYTDDEIARVRALAEERGNGMAMSPDGDNDAQWADLARMGWKPFCQSYELNVCPPTDDQPFFFNMRRIDDLGRSQAGYAYGVDPYELLLLTLGIMLVLSIVGLLAPLALTRSVERPKITSLGYFAALGLGFLLMEIVLIQRFVLFLGFPTYALSVVLFALLVFTGLGSALSTRLPRTRGALVAVLALATGLVTLSAFALPPLLGAMIELPFAVRVGATIVLLAPIGLLVGMPMPLGLHRFGILYPKGVAYAWGVNGIASVLASVLGVAVAITFGYRVATLLAAACYLAAMVQARVSRWPDGSEPERDDGAAGEAADDEGIPVPAS